MGYELQRWALTEQHPCLTPRTRLVLAAICMVSHDDHGEFWMRGKRLISEHLPDMSYSSYKNHLGVLVRTSYSQSWSMAVVALPGAAAHQIAIGSTLRVSRLNNLPRECCRRSYGLPRHRHLNQKLP